MNTKAALLSVAAITTMILWRRHRKSTMRATASINAARTAQRIRQAQQWHRID